MKFLLLLSFALFSLSAFAQKSSETAEVIFKGLNSKEVTIENSAYRWTEKEIGGLIANKAVNLSTGEISYSVRISSDGINAEELFHAMNGRKETLDNGNGSITNFNQLDNNELNPHDPGINCTQYIRKDKTTYHCAIMF